MCNNIFYLGAASLVFFASVISVLISKEFGEITAILSVIFVVIGVKESKHSINSSKEGTNNCNNG
jgi:hypothetical protein